MEARCYRGGEGRTRMNELSYTYRDGIAMAAVLIVTAVLAAMRWL
jgi:energy-coupling factor transport system permease protein